jgi:rRNA-processing protein FCF1
MGSINITFQVESDLDKSELETMLSTKGFENTEPREHMIDSWESKNLKINLYEKSLTVQGKHTEEGVSLLQEILAIDGLSLDPKNQDKLNSFFPKMNAIICPECQKAFYLCKGEISDAVRSDITFKGECGHEINVLPPFRMQNIRIMPDMNILIGNVLSKLIELGFFRKFEIIVTDFMLDWIDGFLGEGKKKGASNEVENLLSLANKKDINFVVLSMPEEGKNVTREDFDKKEDNVILKAAMITNSVLITTDSAFKTRAIAEKRPVIFLPDKFVSKLKHAKEVRIGSQ